MKIKEIMLKPISVDEDTFVTKARRIMRDSDLKILPVVDGDKVLGVITEGEILLVTSTKSNVTVKGFVRECPTITPEENIKDAARKMVQEELDEIPVVTDNGKLCGIVRIKEIFKHMDPSNIPPLTVQKIMTPDVKTCSPDDPISKIWANIISLGYSGFPVVTENCRLVGMVTRRDIIKAGYARIGKEDPHGTRSHSSPRVEKIMSRNNIFKVNPDTDIRDTFRLMVEHDIGRLPVEKDGKLVGIVDRYDLIKTVI